MILYIQEPTGKNTGKYVINAETKDNKYMLSIDQLVYMLDFTSNGGTIIIEPIKNK